MRARLHDERRVADATVSGVDTQKVEPARPVAGANDSNRRGRVPVRGPVDARGGRHRLAARPEVADGRERTAAVGEHLERQDLCVGREEHGSFLPGRVARLEKAGVDALHAHDGAVNARAGPPDPVHPPAAGAGHRQLQHVGTRRSRAGRRPHDLARTLPEPSRLDAVTVVAGSSGSACTVSV